MAAHSPLSTFILIFTPFTCSGLGLFDAYLGGSKGHHSLLSEYLDMEALSFALGLPGVSSEMMNTGSFLFMTHWKNQLVSRSKATL